MESSDVQRIADLAKLATDDAELVHYAAELTRIFALVGKMDDVDTREVAPLAHPLELTQRLRADRVSESDQRSHFQQQAPLTERGLYLVPRVID